MGNRQTIEVEASHESQCVDGSTMATQGRQSSVCFLEPSMFLNADTHI